MSKLILSKNPRSGLLYRRGVSSAAAQDYGPLPDLPTVSYASLYQSGDTVVDVIGRMTANAVISLPAGFDEDITDFSMAGVYGLYAPYLKGFVGQGQTQARLRMKPNSSTKASLVPAQGNGGTNQFSMIRPGGGSSVSDQTLFYGLTIEGTDQPASANNEGRPHNYHGVQIYYGHGARFEKVLMKGIPGSWNSPPGETFNFAGYKDVDTVVNDCEVDGINSAGSQVGGSPFGGNNSVGMVLNDCYFHDSYVSSLTFSIAGSSTTDYNTTSRNITTNRCRIWHNGNHILASGKRFTGINHENVQGFVRHNQPDIIVDNMTEWTATHMSFGNAIADNTDIRIIDPVWHGTGPTRNSGCFTIGYNVNYGSGANLQTTAAYVELNGVALTPIHTYSNSGTIAADPAKNYIITHS